MCEDNAARTSRQVVSYTAFERKLVTTPEDQGDAASPDEHGLLGLLGLLAFPTQL